MRSENQLYQIRIADQIRSEFEKTKTYELCKSWQIDFDEKSQSYYSLNPTFQNDVTAINSAWLMYQERQTEVDELKLDYSKAKLSDIKHASLARDVIFERDELQKRVDAIKQLIQVYKDEEKELELKEWEQSTIYGRIAIELEQALKGDHA
ncbi:hypothetical protein [Acinetobacter courvalinii]|uniref:Uncharacterized protein n=1 Tax=Acinetobacter courvalinii TaxID=280147 RepID=A0AA42I4T8_9GAMM|nr:hypothetical protein [Acinetobacter courvalinii]MDH0562187.1 hypothetical protein [Acinetobacter courvalinii]